LETPAGSKWNLSGSPYAGLVRKSLDVAALPEGEQRGLAVLPENADLKAFARHLALEARARRLARRVVYVDVKRVLADRQRPGQASTALFQVLDELSKLGDCLVVLDLEAYQTELPESLEQILAAWEFRRTGKNPMPVLVSAATERTYALHLTGDHFRSLL